MTMRKLKQLITDKGLKQYWIAMQLGIAESTLSWWVTGRSEPTPEQLQNLANLLNVTVPEICDNGQEQNVEVREAL